MKKLCINCGVEDGQTHNVWCPEMHRKSQGPAAAPATIDQGIRQVAMQTNVFLPPVPITFVDNVLKFEEAAVWEDGGLFRRDLAPGSSSWTEGNKLLDFVCPCGCGMIHCIPVSVGPKKMREWLWDGNVEKPTFEPSILSTIGCKWHGYLIKGMFETCSDWRPPV